MKLPRQRLEGGGSKRRVDHDVTRSVGADSHTLAAPPYGLVVASGSFARDHLVSILGDIAKYL